MNREELIREKEKLKRELKEIEKSLSEIETGMNREKFIALSLSEYPVFGDFTISKITINNNVCSEPVSVEKRMKYQFGTNEINIELYDSKGWIYTGSIGRDGTIFLNQTIKRC